ncbi:hypothetical protein ACKWTF_016602 [Chironomus riparius]
MSVRSLLLLLTLVTSNVNAASVDLKCEFNFYKFATVSLQYMCFTRNDLKIVESNTTIENILGIHFNDQSTESVTALTIDKADIYFIPSNLADKMPNLVALTIKNGKLKKLHQSDLRSLTKLKYLNLDKNHIEVLDDGLFDFNTELQLIWFYNNKITRIGSLVFNNLKSLVNLDLSNNICISKKFAKYKMIKSNNSPQLVPLVLTANILVEINQKCSGNFVKIEHKIESTTIMSIEQIYREKIEKLESRLQKEKSINNKNQEELSKVRKQLNIFSNDSQIFRLEIDLKVQKARIIILEKELVQKESDLLSMSNDLSNAHESIKRFEEEIALNYATHRRADRAEISKLEDEKAEMHQKIKNLQNFIKVLKKESEAKIRNAAKEIEGLKALLFKEETQEIDIVETELNSYYTVDAVTDLDEFSIVDDSTITLDAETTDTITTKTDSNTEATYDDITENTESTSEEPNDSTQSLYDTTGDSQLSIIGDTVTEENIEVSTTGDFSETSTMTNEDESYSKNGSNFKVSKDAEKSIKLVMNII